MKSFNSFFIISFVIICSISDNSISLLINDINQEKSFPILIKEFIEDPKFCNSNFPLNTLNAILILNTSLYQEVISDKYDTLNLTFNLLKNVHNKYNELGLKNSSLYILSKLNRNISTDNFFIAFDLLNRSLLSWENGFLKDKEILNEIRNANQVVGKRKSENNWNFFLIIITPLNFQQLTKDELLISNLSDSYFHKILMGNIYINNLTEKITINTLSDQENYTLLECYIENKDTLHNSIHLICEQNSNKINNMISSLNEKKEIAYNLRISRELNALNSKINDSYFESIQMHQKQKDPFKEIILNSKVKIKKNQENLDQNLFKSGMSAGLIIAIVIFVITLGFFIYFVYSWIRCMRTRQNEVDNNLNYNNFEEKENKQNEAKTTE